MTLRTASLSLKRDKKHPAYEKASDGADNGSLSVRLVKGKDVMLPPGMENVSSYRHDGQIFVVFDNTMAESRPVACCCITDDHEVRRGINFESNSRFASEMLIRRYPDRHFLEISTFHMLNPMKAHRAKGLLWRAITGYCKRNAVDYVLGCFSFDGKYPAAYAMELSYLYHYCQADPGLQVIANRGATMDIMPVEAINPGRAFRFLPPLLRYCLRLGGRVSNMVVVDKGKDAMDILLILPARTIQGPAF